MELENEFVRVGFDSRTGGFASLYDKRTRREYVAAPDRALLFRLMIGQTGRPCSRLDAAAPEIGIAGNRAVITYRLAGAEAVVNMELEGDALLARMLVRNTGTCAVEEIMFPLVRGVAPLPEGSFVWPHFHFRRLGNPFGSGLGGDHHSWNESGQKFTGRYPHWLASAWMDYGDMTGGIAMEGRHTDFTIMDFFIHKVVEKTYEPVRRSLDMMTVHPRRIDPGTAYETPPVRITLHEKDWHTVARKHREWLRTWVAVPELPAKFAEGIGWHFSFMKHQDGHVANTYADLPKLAEASLAAGCPYLLVFGWQTGGHDNNYLYRYVPNEEWGGKEALKAGIEKCRALGVEVVPFYNGTLANVALPEHGEFGHRWEAKSRDGHPYYAGNWVRHNFDAPTRNREMLHHEICPCDEHRRYFLDTVRRIVREYGFGNAQLDQISEKMFLCYNAEHAHEHPDRAYVDGLGALLPQVRQIVREENPDGVIIGEGYNNFTAQWVDGAWNWHAFREFPDPIFYTTPWAWGSLEIDALEYDLVNRAFANKLYLDMKIDGGDSPITKYPKFAAFVRERAELRRRVRDYYVYAEFRGEDEIERVSPEGATVKAFLNSEARKVGIVVAELEGKETEVSFASGWKPAEGSFTAFSSAGTEVRMRASDRLSVRLAPFEVRVLCMDL